MHTRMLNIGFSKQLDGSYYHLGLVLTVTINADESLSVKTAKGAYKPTSGDAYTIDMFEDDLICGVFGEI